MKRTSSLFLRDILECIAKIKEYTSSLELEELKDNQLVLDAVVRNIEVIGEAVKNIPAGIKEKYPYVPWIRIQNFRNIVVHKYWEIDFEILVDILQSKLDELEEQVQGILATEGE